MTTITIILPKIRKTRTFITKDFQVIAVTRLDKIEKCYMNYDKIYKILNITKIYSKNRENQ